MQSQRHCVELDINIGLYLYFMRAQHLNNWHMFHIFRNLLVTLSKVTEFKIKGTNILMQSQRHCVEVDINIGLYYHLILSLKPNHLNNRHTSCY